MGLDLPELGHVDLGTADWADDFHETYPRLAKASHAVEYQLA